MFGWWSDTVTEIRLGSHARGSYRVKIRLHPVYHVRSHVLFRVVRFFKHAMYPMGEMSPIEDSVWPPAGIETFDPWPAHNQHIDPFVFGCGSNMGASRARARRKPQRYEMGIDHCHRTWRTFHSLSGV